jgi:PKD repeat protein
MLGDYVVSLRVNDGNWWSLTDLVNISVVANQPPVAVISATPTTGTTPLTVQLDGTQSYDPEGQPLSFTWQFGNGEGSDTPTTSSDYGLPGTYNVILTVADSFGAQDQASVEITVLPPANHPPETSPTATPNTGYAPLTVQFAANASDADNDALFYIWDFGDGSTSSLLDPSHTYVLAGNYTAWLTVSDGKDSVMESLAIVVNPDIAFSIDTAIVKWQKAPFGDVSLNASLTYLEGATPVPDDVITLRMDGVELFSLPFSAFSYVPRTGDYEYKSRGLMVKMNFMENTLVVGTPSKTNLFGFDASNGVQVEVAIGQAAAVETITMTEAGKNRLVYQRP